MQNSVTVVITSCGRLDLLDRTIKSFHKHNTFPIEEFIIIDDSGNENVHEQLKKEYNDCHLILNPENRGLIKCIDDVYSRVKTPYIFHSEDDWEYIRSNFLYWSHLILSNHQEIMQVWIRGDNNPNGHLIEPIKHSQDVIPYKYVGTNFQGIWHGFSFNPGLRRLADYEKFAPYDAIRLNDYEGHDIAIRECQIGQKYYEAGFRAVTLLHEYCVHIGGERSSRV